ncbi:MAG TPA: response regulator [Chthonomonadaceae bacterium]|nr:response regulator [Chthonomonadaceae bacterium]
MTSETMTPQRALICEDEGLHVMAIRKALLKAGYQVAGEAREGREAITLAKDLKPDLVLMDINMPGPVDGIAATREILQTHPMPIIMLTAYSDDESVNSALDAGACAYLVKPITSEQLLPAIKAAMTNFQSLQEALHETAELKDALETRKLVEKAKGIYMEKRQVPEAEAFRAIQKMSRDKCQTMRQTALDIIKASEIF